ncbi:MAG: hypothetical protein II732_10385 [Lachnospiraceae bacterium]|nr:hypothetical protein [Lachnospiraceae bacterium]
MRRTDKTFLGRKFYSMLLSGTLTMVVVTLLLMSDTVIAGFFVGEKAVEAINLITPAYSLAAFFGSLVTLGVKVLYSNSMGRFDKESADRYLGNGFTASLLAGIIMYVLLQLFADAYLGFYAPPGEVLELAGPYFFWYRLVILILPMTNFMNEMIFADGDETLSAVANGVQVVGNIVLSIVLCRFIGIAGIGAATFAGTLLSLVISFMHLAKKGNSLHIRPALSAGVLAEISKYSAIDAGSYLFLAIFFVIMNKYVTVVFGKDMLILVSICIFLKESQLVFDGIGEAISPLISVYLGEETYGGVRKCYALSRKAAIAEGIIMTVLIAAIAPLMIRIFGISDPATAAYAAGGTRIMALGLAFTSLMYLMSSYYLLRGKILLGVVGCALRDLIVSAVFAVTGGCLFGIYGMFAGIALSSLGAYLIFEMIIRARYGRDDSPLLLGELERGRTEGFYELVVEPEDIIRVQKQAEGLLIDHNVPEKTTSRVKLLIEDLYMLIYEKNSPEEVLGECVISLTDEGILIITRDDGMLFDISEDDTMANSVVSFAVSGYMVKMKDDKAHLTTMSYNRNSFLVKYS